jgi:drug/metabolite transporter (DMT)-like permease
MMFGALVSGAMASVLVSRSPDDLDPFILNAAQLTLGGVGLLALAALRGEAPYHGLPGLGFWLAMLWLMLVTGGGFSIWYYLIKVRKESLSEMAVWRFLIPLGGAVFSWIFLSGDTPALLSLGGVLLTALSIILFYREPRRTVSPAGQGE